VTRSRLVIALFVFFVAGVVTSHAQSGQVCISQETADACANALDTVSVQTKEIEALKDALRNRDAIIEGLKIAVAVEAQKAVGNEAQVIRLTAILEAMMKSYTKPKKWGLIVF